MKWWYALMLHAPLLNTLKNSTSSSMHSCFTYALLHQDLWHIILGAYLPGVFHEEANGTWVSVSSWGKLLESAFCHPDGPIINLESTNRECPVRFKNKHNPVLKAWTKCMFSPESTESCQQAASRPFFSQKRDLNAKHTADRTWISAYL